MKGSVLWVSALVLFVSTALFVHAQTQKGIDADESRFREQLRDAGYQYTRESLLLALRDSDDEIATIAAARLPEFPGTPEVIAALRERSREPSNWLSLVATNSLRRLGATGWEDDAVARLDRLESPDRMLLAGILAQVGRTDGWPAVREALHGDKQYLWAGAAESAIYFDGLTTSSGETVDARAELLALKARAEANPRPPASGRGRIDPLRSRIDTALTELAKRRGRGNNPAKPTGGAAAEGGNGPESVQR